jgi:hypothetical protein
MLKMAKYYDRGPSVDDQPGFVNRDNKGQGWNIFMGEDKLPANEDDIKKRWKRRKRRRVIPEELPKGSI